MRRTATGGARLIVPLHGTHVLHIATLVRSTSGFFCLSFVSKYMMHCTVLHAVVCTSLVETAADATDCHCHAAFLFTALNHARQPPLLDAICPGAIPRPRAESGPHQRTSLHCALEPSTAAAQQCLFPASTAAILSRPNSTASLPDASEAPVQESPRPGPCLQPFGNGKETGGCSRAEISCRFRTGGRPPQWLVIASGGRLPAASIPLPCSPDGRQGWWCGWIPPGLF
jgi:hypothetical protein